MAKLNRVRGLDRRAYRIEKALEEKGWSQRELARRLYCNQNAVRMFINSLKNGKNPKISTIRKYSKILEIPIEKLIFRHSTSVIEFDLEKNYTIAESASILGVSKRTLYVWTRNKQINYLISEKGNKIINGLELKNKLIGKK